MSANNRFQSRDCRLYLITDDRGRSLEDLERIIVAAVRGGVTAVQFREKSAAPSFCSKAFPHLSRICKDFDMPMLINADLLGRWELNTEPDAIHFNERTLPLHPHDATRIAGYSAHDIEEARHAFEHGVDFCTFSPIFETPSKSDFLPAVGLKQLSAMRRAIPTNAVIALGGIDLTNARKCIEAGADGVAVMRAIMSAPDPEGAARDLRLQIDAALDARGKSTERS